MASHKVIPGIGRVTLGKRGIRFTKKASKYNNCIGDELRGKKHASRKAVRDAFTAAVGKCK